MQKLLKMKKTLLALLGLLVFVSCSDDEEVDNTAPSILEATMDGEDHDLSFNDGDQVALQVDLSDNVELSQLKLDIHDLFDGHSHGKSNSTWEMTKVYTVSGASATVNDNLDVPSPVVAGPYHVILQLVDAAGNESDFKELEFIVKNGSEPQFGVTAPDFSNEVHAPKGQAFAMAGTITDDVDLDEILIRISEEHDDHNHKKSGEAPIFEDDVDLPGSSDTSFDLSTLSITIPADAEEGHYIIEISAKDNDGNYGIWEAEIHVM